MNDNEKAVEEMAEIMLKAHEFCKKQNKCKDCISEEVCGHSNMENIATALDAAGYRKQNDTVCPMCLDCHDNCLLEGKHPMTSAQVRAETAKEFGGEIIWIKK